MWSRFDEIAMTFPSSVLVACVVAAAVVTGCSRLPDSAYTLRTDAEKIELPAKHAAQIAEYLAAFHGTPGNPRMALPTADAEKLKDRPRELVVSVSSDGRYMVNRQPLEARSVEALTARLKEASGGQAETVVIVTADAVAAHQSVVNVLDAARRAGLARITFAAQTPQRGR